ncbi:alkaline phosphatase D family protein [Pelagicoccus sp. SDUM812003]|uniref:alkaline phosphatase D family protein n=1 Tax=Pelagicoccus sp. SDUM812003 TaxID=3041267 RepID=UPI00280F4F41|nr:alkaline phosphatase D family protein [Pelagicoccus sp. SDUM812003]MDQ8205482.1 alkaline phosphatase D family protein [Pelagicoccus sp. SDUM812003]
MRLFHLFIISACLLPSRLIFADATLLNGPMPGASSMTEVVIWTQTSEPASVQIEYWQKNSKVQTVLRSPLYQTSRDQACVAKVSLTEGLAPGEHYEYAVLVDGEPHAPAFREGYELQGPVPMEFQVKPRWRFVPEGELAHSVFDFRIAAGSCAYINEKGYDREGGTPYGGEYHIFESIFEKDPDLMLWLGDCIYYRENDFESEIGMQRRWTHDRQLPELQPLLASAHHFAIWDDHDYGPNDIGRSFTLKGAAKDTFDLFWANPSSGLPETPGIFTFLNWGDVNIYLLDNRTYLSSATSHPERFNKPKAMLGEKQVDWLINHLVWAQSQMENDGKSYPARFNLICVGNQVLNESGNPHGYRNFHDEWQYLIDRIVEEGIDGVVFLSGDVHFSEVNRLVYKGGGRPGVPGKAGIKGEDYVFYELTSSSLTSGSWAGHENNPARFDIFDDPKVDRVGQRNFMTLDFKGPLKDRRMEVRYFDSDGNLLNRKRGGRPDEITEASIFRAADLRAPKP